jgi:hypothetical protein
MKKYNYKKAMLEDVLEYISEHYTQEELLEELEDKDDFFDKLNDDMWICDSVTGNASGSYTFNTYKAKEYVEGNLDILREAIEEFCVEPKIFMEKFLDEEWEHFDVTIRCYLLSGAIREALSELEEELEEDFEKCSFCGEWFEKSELNDGLCTYCRQEIESRGEGIRK